MKKNRKIGVLGYGNMGACLGKALADNGWSVFAYDKDETKIKRGENISFCETAEELISCVEVVIIAVKPQDISSLIDNYGRLIGKVGPLVLSIAAGVSTLFFEKKIEKIRVIRVMPNLAAQKRRSFTFITSGKFSTQNDCSLAEEIFNCVGESEVIDEKFLDKVTAITGSGPGYAYYFLECFYKSALALGFDKKIAKKMVQQTLEGALCVIKESSDSFDVWIKRVASKGGTTQAALDVWKEARCEEIIEKGVRAAYNRAEELDLTD